MPEDKDLPQRKTESDVNADADSKGKKAAKASSKKDAHRARVFQQRLGSGHFAPFVAVLLLTVAAWALFFSNPGDANIAEVKAIASGEVGSIEHVINNGLHLGALIALSVLTFWLLISPWWASQKAPASDSAEHSPFVGRLRSAVSAALSRRAVAKLVFGSSYPRGGHRWLSPSAST